MNGADPDVRVVGAGLAGLSAALCLAQQGLRVEVLEGAEAPGGRARSWIDETTGDAVDIGPHIVLSAYPNFLDLLQQLGTRDKIVWEHDRFLTMVEGRREIVLRSRRLPAPLPFLPSVVAAPVAPLRERLASARILRRALRLDEPALASLDDQSADQFLRDARVPERMIDWHWRSLTLYLLNVPLERCSAAALMRVFRYLVTHNHAAPGFPATGLSDLYVPAVLARVREAGGSLRTRCAVRALAAADGRLQALVLDDGRRLAAERCIVAVPPAELAAMLPVELRGEPAFRDLGRFEPSPYVSVYQWFSQKLTSRRFWARPWTEHGLSGESYDLSNIRPHVHGGGSLIATNVIYAHGAATLDDTEIVRRVRAELVEYLPAAGEGLAHWRVHRIPMAVPCPDVGTERRRPQARTPLAGLVLAGDWTATGLPCSMESAVRSGRLAAEAVCAELDRPRRFALRPPQPEGASRWFARRRRAPDVAR